MYIDSRRQSNTFQICIYTKIYTSKSSKGIKVDPIFCLPCLTVFQNLGSIFLEESLGTPNMRPQKKNGIPEWGPFLVALFPGGVAFWGGVSPRELPWFFWGDAKSSPTGEITRQPGEHPKQWWCYWWALRIWKIRWGRDFFWSGWILLGIFWFKDCLLFLLKKNKLHQGIQQKNNESWEFWSCPEMRMDRVGCDQSSHHGLWACPGVQSSWDLTPPWWGVDPT